MNPSTSLADLAWEEVVALHALFEAWLREGGPDVDFSECEASMGRDFRMISPDGAIMERTAIIAWIRGARRSRGPDFTVQASDPLAIWASESSVLLEYTEQQYRDGRTTRRRSTALFHADPAAPRGVVWRHLQETWLPSGEEDQG